MRTKEELLTEMARCVRDMEDEEVTEVTQEYADAGYDPQEGIMNGLVVGMNEAGKLYEEEEYYIGLIQAQIDQLISTDRREQELRSIQKEIDTLEHSIKAQVKALRAAPAATRPYLEADINEMTEEISEKRRLLSKMEQAASDDQQQIRDFEGIKQLILSLGELLKEADPQEIVGLINSIIERIYVTRDGKEEVCHIFIKGCQEENYEGLFHQNTSSSDESENVFDILCDSDECRQHHSHHGRGAAAAGLL